MNADGTRHDVKGVVSKRKKKENCVVKSTLVGDGDYCTLGQKKNSAHIDVTKLLNSE